MDKLRFKEHAACLVVAAVAGVAINAPQGNARSPADEFKPQGVFHMEHWRDGKLIQTYEAENTVTTDGKNKALDTAFRGVTQVNPWYIGIINNAGFGGTQVTDTMSAHPGWAEFTGYSEGTRQAWSPAAAANASLTNSASLATFNITATATLQGLFVTSVSTKGGTTGTLWSAASFSTTVPVLNGDQIKLTYTLNS
jgi:hypothetical protein